MLFPHYSSARFVVSGMSLPLVLHSVAVPAVTLRLHALTCIVGRSAQCDLIIEDHSVSRRHAEIRLLETTVALTDLGSRNGTFVEHRRVSTSRVLLEQVVRFGNVSFILSDRARSGGKPEREEETESGDGQADAAHPVDGRNTVALLTPAQRRVFNQLLSGYSEKRIARQLALSSHTVHNHVRAVYRLLGVHSRPELLAQIWGGE
jgi:DNA-binding CsgD family transcriptional regulator